MKKHYITLEVGESATQGEIKKSWKKLSGIYHPDKQRGSTAKQTEINEAYSVLADPQKRALYDKAGDSEQIDYSIDDMASELIYRVFLAKIGKEFNRDTLFRDIYDSTSKVLRELESDKERLRERKSKLESTIYSLNEIFQAKYKGGMTTLHRAFNDRIEALEQEIDSLDFDSANLGIAIHEKVLEILKDKYPPESEH